jgi:hypothetical protein
MIIAIEPARYGQSFRLLQPDPDGYEVCRIYIISPHKAFGVDFKESEVFLGIIKCYFLKTPSD